MSRLVEDPEGFFSSLVPDRDDLLLSLETEAAAEGIPIVGPVVGRFLEILVRATGARKVLELGCAIGYSAIFLARGLSGKDGKVLTVERSTTMADRAALNFERAGFADRVDILRGEAPSILETLEGPLDFIFLDVEKSVYLESLPGCRRLLRPCGLLLADNTAFKDASPFVRALAVEEEWQSVHLLSFLPGHSPGRDGLSIAQKPA